MNKCFTHVDMDTEENLNFLLVNRFDEILLVTSVPGDLAFKVYVRTGVIISSFVKKLTLYIMGFLAAEESSLESCRVDVYQNRVLVYFC